VSELTRCNFCTLQRIMRSAAEVGATVTTRYEDPVPGHELDRWIAAIRSDKDKPSAYFKQLTTHCVC